MYHKGNQQPTHDAQSILPFISYEHVGKEAKGYCFTTFVYVIVSLRFIL